MIFDMLKGFAVTFRYIFRPKPTLEWPEEPHKIPARFRGRHFLARYSGGQERCVACYLCQKVCPARAITIESEERPDGTRYPTRYDINMIRCIFCGFCEDACPEDAIILGSTLEFPTLSRAQMIYTKKMLLDLAPSGFDGKQPPEKDSHSPHPYQKYQVELDAIRNGKDIKR
ncbi:NADH-quinone oxidoreductase subunit NuoI [bacterium]|nr:NADH-quinone oxidoreductase subunit NuoI [bacterium]